jgi:transposase-like protein
LLKDDVLLTGLLEICKQLKCYQRLRGRLRAAKRIGTGRFFKNDRLMDIQYFMDIVGSDKKALWHLESICSVIGGNVCPKCGEDDIYRIDNGKRKRCQACGYRFTLYTGRWLNEAHISPETWLWIIKLFEMGLTAKRISDETGKSYPTTLKAVTAIRRSIAAATPHGREYLHDPGASRKIPVFYMSEDGKHDITAPLPSTRIHVIGRLGYGHLICTDKKVRYDRLICEGVTHRPADFGRGHPRFRFYMALPPVARRSIMEKLLKYHGVKNSMLPLYVLEMEYRLNNRGGDLLELLIEGICRFIPRKTPGLLAADPGNPPLIRVLEPVESS